MKSPVIQKMFPALVDAAHTIGAVQTRNLGTLGGNLVTAVPSMDSGPTLMALEAIVSIQGPEGRREVPLTDFFLGPRKTILKADEILAEIIIPKQNLGKPTHFLKFGLRKGQALALVNVGASFWVDEDTNTFVAPRIGLGAVAPKVIRAPQAEAYLEGREITPEAMAEAGPHCRHRRKAYQRFPGVGRVPEKSGRGTHQTGTGRRIRSGASQAIGRGLYLEPAVYRETFKW